MAFEDQFFILIDPGFLGDPKKNFRFATPEAYVETVRRVLLTIAKTKVGDILLRSIRWHGNAIRITPVDTFDTTTCGTDDTIQGESKDLFYNKFFVRSFLLPPIRAVVHFNAHWHQPGGTCHSKHAANEHYTPTPESVLLHELAHAFRFVSNKESRGQLPLLGKGWDVGDAEEFLAVLVENIFQSELGRNIRRSHSSGFKNLDKDLEGSFEFFQVTKKAFEYVDIFCRDNRGLTRALAKINVPFNPIMAYYQNPGKAQQMSSSAVAARRDS